MTELTKKLFNYNHSEGVGKHCCFICLIHKYYFLHTAVRDYSCGVVVIHQMCIFYFILFMLMLLLQMCVCMRS